MVVLKMNEDNDKRCSFVSETGCRVYNDRPWPCRMYPLNMNDDGTFSLIADPENAKAWNNPIMPEYPTGSSSRVSHVR
jgi:Fe-S-cluster containining protein